MDKVLIDVLSLSSYSGPMVDIFAYCEFNINLKFEQDNKIEYWSKFVEVFNA